MQRKQRSTGHWRFRRSDRYYEIMPTGGSYLELVGLNKLGAVRGKTLQPVAYVKDLSLFYRCLRLAGEGSPAGSHL